MATTTSNMSLTKPGVGTEPSPDWATQLNDNADTLDVHDHSSGKGVKITPSGLNIDADLTFNSNDATALRSTRYTSQGSVLNDAADKGCIYDVNGDLYWNNSSGTAVQITSGSGINIASTGTIGGDYGQPGVTASATYSDTTKTFTWTQASTITAKMALGDILLYENSASTNPITIKSPTSLAASYDIVLPSSAPTADQVLRQNNGNTATEYVTVQGTANEVTVTHNSGDITISANGVVPLGGLIPIASNITGAATIPATGTASNGWQYCDGAAIAGGQTLSGTTPNLTDDRFIMGDTVAGNTGGDNAMAHTHSFSHTHTTDSKLGTITLSHSHTVNSHSHNIAHTHIWSAHSTSGSWYGSTNQSGGNGSNDGKTSFTTSDDQLMQAEVTGSGSGDSVLKSTGFTPSSGSTRQMYTTGIVDGPSGTGSSAVSGTSSPGTNSQLSNYNASHSHSTTSQSTSTTGAASVTENRPLYITAQYLIRVS